MDNKGKANKKQKKNKQNKKQQNSQQEQPAKQMQNSIRTHLQLIRHQQGTRSEDIYKKYPFEHIHYPFIELGLKINRGKITSHTVICRTILLNTKALVLALTSPEPSFREYMGTKLSNCKKILAEFVKFSESIENVFSFLFQINSMVRGTNPIEEAKSWVVERIDEYLFQKFTNAEELIVENALSVIKENDHVLVPTHSPLLLTLVRKAVAKGIKFVVYVVCEPKDPRGRADCLAFQRAGAKVVLTSYSNVAYFMPIISKVFIPGTTIYSNGYALSKSGAAVVALFAKKHRKPFYVLIHTFMFSEKSQIDSLMINKSNYEGEGMEEIVELEHDLVPSKLISLLITEIGFMPPTSVPVVLREFKYDVDRLEFRN